MTDRTLLKNAFIAALCEHPSAASYRERLFSGSNLDSLARQLAESGATISKQDFLTKSDQGQYFLDSPQGWRNLHKIVRLIEKNGEHFEAQDFLTVIGPQDKNFIDSAISHNGLAHLFNPDIWKGRYAEVQNLYYHIPVGQRRPFEGAIDILNIKRRIYAAEDKAIREDILAGLDVDWRDFPSMFRTEGGIERLRSIAARLERNGDFLCKEDILFTDGEGDSCFYYQSAWENFGEIAGMIARGGEKFEVEDFLISRGSRPNLLQRAQSNNALDKVFSADVWGDRLSDMVALWRRMKPLEKAELGFEKFANLVSQAEDRVYGGLLNLDSSMDIKDLTQPLAVDGKNVVYPLGLSSTWENWDKIRPLLKSKGQGLNVSDLRRKSGYMQRPVMEIAVQNGHFKTVVAMLVDGRQGLSVEDLMQKDIHGQNLLLTIARQGELKTLFVPELWAGRLNDMKTLWAQVQIEHKSQVDWKKVLNDTNVATLHQGTQHNKPPLKRRR